MPSEKVKLIQEVIKRYIDDIPGSWEKKAEKLRLNKGEVYRLYQGDVIPTLERIIHLEGELKKDIIIINQEGLSLTKDYHMGNRPKNICLQSIYDNYFGDLHKDLKNAFEETDNTLGLRLDIRLTKKYISFNLVPDGKEIGGYHLMTFQYKQREKMLQIAFIVPDFLFEYEKQKFKLKPGSLPTIYKPNRVKGENYNFPGQPSMNIELEKLPEEKDKIVKNIIVLCKRVFEIQDVDGETNSPI